MKKMWKLLGYKYILCPVCGRQFFPTKNETLCSQGCFMVASSKK